MWKSGRRKQKKEDARTLKRKEVVRAVNLSPSLTGGLLAAIVLFFGLIRLRLLNFPLERDEGEFAYAGQLILHGIAPYRLCYTMKLPGTAAAYAFFLAVFGQTPAGVHLGLLVVNSATIVLLYFLAARLFGRLAGVVAAASFALLSIQPSVLGFAAHATQFVLLPAVGGILLLLKALESGRLSLSFYSGVALGLAFLMKQPGVVFVVFALLYLMHRLWKRPLPWRTLASRSGILVAGFTLPLVFTALVLWKTHVFGQFWFWTFSYARQYATISTFSGGLQNFWSTGLPVVSSAVFVWLIALAGIVVMFWDPEIRHHIVFTLGFLAFSFAAVCPGLYFREHYFVLLLPAVSLLCAVAVGSTTTMLLKSRTNAMWALLPVFVFVLAAGVSVVGQSAVFFEDDPLTVCRKMYGYNPFPEAVQVSDFLKSHSREGDRVAVIGSEPEIYFYSGLRSATGYIYMYPLMEVQPFASVMQQQMIAEIETSRPEFLIFVSAGSSWLKKDDSDTTVFSWGSRYSQSNYDLIGDVDILKQGTEYHWSNAATFNSHSENRILLYKRKAPPS